jgi:CHAT domain-containing protein/Flp pilus assembly protein TadD
LLGLGLLLPGQLPLAQGRAAPEEQPTPELSKEERSRLEKEAAELVKHIEDLYGRAELTKATALQQKALALYRQLYPKERFPQGHPLLAENLHNLGFLLQARQEYTQAEPFYREAVAMLQQLYAKERYPQGHPDLANSLANLGSLLRARGEYAQAEPLYREALAMRQRLYPKEHYPQGHPDLAISLNNLGLLLQVRGDYAQAEPYYRDALALYRELYPKERFPQGHPDLATSLNNLGGLLESRGEYAQAESYYRDALAMQRQLYPQGHPLLASSLNNLGLLLQARGEYAQAEPFLRDALRMQQQLYPKERHPQGHPDLAISLNNLGYLLESRGEYAQAEPFYRQALTMQQQLYPKERFPRGHPDLATSLNNLGVLLRFRGEYAPAEPFLRDALAMRRQLYPKDRYPQGHPDLASSLNNLGHMRRDRGEYAQAEPFLRDGLAMYQGLAEAYAALAAEAQALNYLASLPAIRDAFLSISAEAQTPAADAYELLWEGKAALTRVLEQRQRFFRATNDFPSRAKVDQLLDVRQQLARLLLAPAGGLDDKDRPRRLQELTERKETLETELARLLPELARQRDRRLATPAALIDKLAPGSAFVDLLRYRRLGKGPQAPAEAYCVAFVLGPGRPVRRVELGPAAPVEEALASWRQAIRAEQRGDAGERLRRLLWEPVARQLPEGIDTIYLAPDGELSALPWAALPGSRAGSVLLEEYTFAVVPHGPWLLEQFAVPARTNAAPGLLLALGGVAYGAAPDPVVAPPGGELLVARRPDRGPATGAWLDLPGTVRELDQLVALARGLPQPPQTLERRGTSASTVRLQRDLPQARWAHLATHGFFAAPKSDVRRQLFDDRDFVRGVGAERRGVGARNPLTQSGLVLAGANLPVKDLLKEDGGILTAEAIAGLPLHNLELAVLSACETGLGEVAAGEGVFGLQRAFHLAGVRNVIASLWKVDDQATAALMGLFYHKLWRENKPPLVALHEAQLTLYHQPERIGKLAQARGLDFDKEVRLPADPPKEAQGLQATGKAPVRLWAGFVISGSGR